MEIWALLDIVCPVNRVCCVRVRTYIYKVCYTYVLHQKDFTLGRVLINGGTGNPWWCNLMQLAYTYYLGIVRQMEGSDWSASGLD